jgi:acyl carrier protein
MTTSSKPALTREQVHATLWQMTAEQIGKQLSDLTPKSRLVQDLGADSLDATELGMQVEEKLSVTLPEELFENPDLTLGEIEEAIWAQR